MVAGKLKKTSQLRLCQAKPGLAFRQFTEQQSHQWLEASHKLAAMLSAAQHLAGADPADGAKMDVVALRGRSAQSR